MLLINWQLITTLIAFALCYEAGYCVAKYRYKAK
jgi:hypothetical protein